MPRSASAGGSSRRATRFSAPSGSPAASARAAAVISESIGIPSHLSLPPFDQPVLTYLTVANQPTCREWNERRSTGNGENDDKTQDRNTRRVARSADRIAAGGEGIHAAQRRAGGPTTATAVGPDQQGLSIRYRRG